MTRMIRIFDTTLRDGEQSPGASMNVEEKVMVAKQLARLGVDIIEAGFAYSSPGDFEAVRRIAQEVEGPTICSLARARPEDIDRAWEALKGAPKVRIHTFLSTSDIHLKHQFRMTRDEAKKRAVEMVQRARGYVDDVEFSPMDASRSDPAVSLRSHRGGHHRRGRHGQHSRYGGLCDSAGVWQAHQRDSRTGAEQRARR